VSRALPAHLGTEHLGQTATCVASSSPKGRGLQTEISNLEARPHAWRIAPATGAAHFDGTCIETCIALGFDYRSPRRRRNDECLCATSAPMSPAKTQHSAQRAQMSAISKGRGSRGRLPPTTSAACFHWRRHLLFLAGGRCDSSARATTVAQVLRHGARFLTSLSASSTASNALFSAHYLLPTRDRAGLALGHYPPALRRATSTCSSLWRERTS
jgi:hypothetical protein